MIDQTYLETLEKEAVLFSKYHKHVHELLKHFEFTRTADQVFDSRKNLVDKKLAYVLGQLWRDHYFINKFLSEDVQDPIE